MVVSVVVVVVVCVEDPLFAGVESAPLTASMVTSDAGMVNVIVLSVRVPEVKVKVEGVIDQLANGVTVDVTETFVSAPTEAVVAEELLNVALLNVTL